MIQSICVGMQFLAVILCLGMLIHVYGMEPNERQKGLMILLFTVTIQNVGYLFELQAENIEAAMIAIKFEYVGGVFNAFFLAMFIYIYCSVNIPKAYKLSMIFTDLLILFIMWDTERNHLFYTSYTFDPNNFPHVQLQHGPFYFIFVVCCCVFPVLVSVIGAIYAMKVHPWKLAGKYMKEYLGLILVPIFLIVLESLGWFRYYDVIPITNAIMLMIALVAFWSKNSYSLENLTSKTMVEVIENGVIVMEIDGTITAMNQKAVHIFGDLHGVNVKQYIPKIRNIISGLSAEETQIEQNGSVYGTTISPIVDKRNITQGYILILYDMTEQIEHSEENRRLKEEADAANRSKSQFLSNMSHEIRTPMNAVVGMTDILLRQEEDEEKRKLLNNIKQSGKTLVQIINDILDFSKIESGNLKLVEEPYSLTEVIENLGLICLDRIGLKPVELIFDIDPKLPQRLWGDGIRVQQIMLNLLNNAIKFTDKGKVELKIRTKQTGFGTFEVYISVSDTGIGIRKEELGNIFRSFSQVDVKKNKSKEGTGLGLAISLELAEKLGGYIHVESTYGVGSTFSCMIRQGYISDELATVLPAKDKVSVSACFSNYYLKENVRKLAEDFGVEYISEEEYALEDKAPALMFTDWDSYQNQKHILDKIPTEVIIMKNPMLEGEIDWDGRCYNEPLFSKVFCEILANKAEQKKEADSQETLLEGDGKKILLVEDNEMNIVVTKGLLEPSNLQIDVVTNGLEALNLIRERGDEYHLVLMDHMMPVMDGVEATIEIRKFDKRIPIVALSANVVKHAQEEFIHAGMNDVVAKPIDIEHLLQVIKKNIR